MADEGFEDLDGEALEPSDKIEEGELYLCTGLDNAGKDQCEFLALCTDPEPEDDAGCFFKGEFIAASCPYCSTG